MPRHPSTTPGFRNKNGQQVIAKTSFPSDKFPGQVIYRMRCTHCDHEYGCIGVEIHARRCPRHQDGAKGEPLREVPPSLFADLSSQT